VPCRADPLSQDEFFRKNGRIGKEVSADDFYRYIKEFSDTRATVAKERLELNNKTCHESTAGPSMNRNINQQKIRTLSLSIKNVPAILTKSVPVQIKKLFH
jgi:hypothetical protein